MAFIDLASLPGRQLLEGAEVRFVHSENMTLAYWIFQPGCLLPEHSHPHEQVANLIEGQFELTVEGESRVLTPGQVAFIPPEARHSGRSITVSRIIDVFYPVREDFK